MVRKLTNYENVFIHFLHPIYLHTNVLFYDNQEVVGWIEYKTINKITGKADY